MILAAGRGTRLAPLTDTTPKPMLPVAGYPLIHWQLAALSEAGVTDVVINLHHLGEQIEAFVGDGSAWQLEVEYSRERELLETGGGVVQALPMLGDGPFWVLNGDIWTDFDFNNLPTTLPSRALAHFVLTPTPSWRQHGDFEAQEGWVTRRGETYCYCGIALWDPRAFAAWSPSPFSLTEIFFPLVEQTNVSCQIHTGRWDDIGTLDHYQSLTK